MKLPGIMSQNKPKRVNLSYDLKQLPVDTRYKSKLPTVTEMRKSVREEQLYKHKYNPSITEVDELYLRS